MTIEKNVDPNQIQSILDNLKINFSAKIDSLRLEYFYDDVTIVSNQLDKHLMLVDTEGEVVDELKKNSLSIRDKGITTSYIVVERWNFIKKSTVKYVQVLINAKALESNYFKGINKETIIQLHEYVCSQNIIKIDYYTFLNGIATDIDICKDYFKPTEIYSETLDKLKDFIAKNYSVATKHFNKEKNKGFQISERNIQNPKKHPFIKWYSKINELRADKNLLFYQSYFKEILEVDYNKHGDYFNDLRRVEGTIKNKKHYEHITGKDSLNSLKNLLELDFNNIIETFIRTYLDTQKKFVFKGKSKGKDLIIQLLIIQMLNDGRNFEDIKKYISNNFEANERTQKKRAIDLITKVASQEIKDLKKYKKDGEYLLSSLMG